MWVVTVVQGEVVWVVTVVQGEVVWVVTVVQGEVVWVVTMVQGEVVWVVHFGSHLGRGAGERGEVVTSLWLKGRSEIRLMASFDGSGHRRLAVSLIEVRH